MRVFESGGSLWIIPRVRLQAALIAAGVAAAAVALPPVLGLYLLVVA